jgi:hypothetical protein
MPLKVGAYGVTRPCDLFDSGNFLHSYRHTRSSVEEMSVFEIKGQPHIVTRLGSGDSNAPQSDVTLRSSRSEDGFRPVELR